MSIINELDSKGYVLNDDELKELIELGVASDNVSTKIKGDYFRILKETTYKEWQVDLDTEYLDILNSVYNRQYKVIKDVYTKGIHDSLERNRLTNFARSAKSTLVAVYKAGKKPSEIPNTKAECTNYLSSLRTKSSSVPATMQELYEAHWQKIKQAGELFEKLDDKHRTLALDDILTIYPTTLVTKEYTQCQALKKTTTKK